MYSLIIIISVDGVVFVTAVTCSQINIATSLRDNIEDSIVLGSAPIPVSTR